MILIPQYYAMYHFFLYSKSVNNFKILVSPSNKWFNNLSLLFLDSSFSFFISFTLSFADNLKSQNFKKIYILILKSLSLHLRFLRYHLFHHLTYLTFFLYHFLFYSFLVLLIILIFLFHLIWFLNFLTHL